MPWLEGRIMISPTSSSFSAAIAPFLETFLKYGWWMLRRTYLILFTSFFFSVVKIPRDNSRCRSFDVLCVKSLCRIRFKM